MTASAPDSRQLSSIVVTGASGLVGGHFINAAKDCFYIYAIARRSQKESNVPVHDNIRWLRCDIGDAASLRRLIDGIADETYIDYIFHFAGYYDFSYRQSPEYRRTNVDGTRHLLDNAERLGTKRFVFSSSLAVTDFARGGRVIDEKSPADGDFPYAVSKREAEELVAEHSVKFPCTIARLAAVYSDWCEYGPLYVLLNTWLSRSVRSRVIAGRGETAVPYLHVQDLNAFWMRLLRSQERLTHLDILAASPSGCVSHNELFAAATQAYGDRSGKSVHVPRPLATLGVCGMRLLGSLVGRPPFERPWMMRYVDARMEVNPEATHRLLGWAPKPRFHVMRRLLFLIENMKRDPLAWEQRNLAMTKAVTAERPGLKIYSAMTALKQQVVDEHVEYLTSPVNSRVYPSYQKLARRELSLRAELMYQMMESSLRLGDHLSILNYANYLARRRHREGFDVDELKGSLEHIAYSIEKALNGYPGLEDLRKTIHYETDTTMQLILDEIEDTYENLGAGEGNAVC